MSLGTTQILQRSWTRRLRTQMSVSGREAEYQPGFLTLWLIAAWFGLLAGMLELGSLLLQKLISSTVIPESLRRNRHFLWMVPLSNLLIFGSLGLLLALLVRVRPRLILRSAEYL